jgi:hypothetical protein
MTSLTGLHLGQTGIGDQGLVELKPLVRLKKLWLNDTHITNGAVPMLVGLDSLDDLYVCRTKMTVEGVRELKRLRPWSRIYYRSDRDPE